MSEIKVCVGDITKLFADAIVNSANQSLMAGSGLCGAVYKAAGGRLKEACAPFAPLAVGQAIITDGFALPARYIIHTVAPKWYLNHPERALLLASCYQEALRLSEMLQLHSVAFPCVGMGIYRCPLEIGAEIAVKTVLDCILKKGYSGDITFVCANEVQRDCYHSLLKDYELDVHTGAEDDVNRTWISGSFATCEATLSLILPE